MSKMLSFKLHKAKRKFLSEHNEPEVLTIEEKTKVLNLEGTSNHKPNGDFDGSWTRYWIAFSHETEYLFCSQCGKPIWNEENKRSKALCEELIRTKEINKYIVERDEPITMKDLKSHGSHVELDGVTYITPMCCEHNTGNKGEMIELKEESILVEEVDPLILEEE